MGSSKLTARSLPANSPQPTALAAGAAMDRVVACWVAAAKRADELGIDLIELHCAHGAWRPGTLSEGLSFPGTCFRCAVPLETSRFHTSGRAGYLLPSFLAGADRDDEFGGTSIESRAKVPLRCVSPRGHSAPHTGALLRSSWFGRPVLWPFR